MASAATKIGTMAEIRTTWLSAAYMARNRKPM
jgi:hypothetical protein